MTKLNIKDDYKMERFNILNDYELTVDNGKVLLENASGYIELVDDIETVSLAMDLIDDLLSAGWEFDENFLNNHFEEGTVWFDENNVAFLGEKRFDTIEELNGLITLASITEIGGHPLTPVGEVQAKPLSRLEQRGLEYTLIELISDYEKQNYGESTTNIQNLIEYTETYVYMLDDYDLGSVTIDRLFVHQNRVVITLAALDKEGHSLDIEQNYYLD